MDWKVLLGAYLQLQRFIVDYAILRLLLHKKLLGLNYKMRDRLDRGTSTHSNSEPDTNPLAVAWDEIIGCLIQY